ncbi:hypothetical protein LCGC14_2630340, partial [marine sediment metagenome]
MPDYRVNLEIYNGPLDLLLYLIRREEVDVHDIPIARITEQYLAYVDMLKVLDPNLAGEFLVMAATLMEIKTRMLLPTAPPEEAGEEGLEIDPRTELVRQLLEYKAFKDAAGDLADAARCLQSIVRHYARRPHRAPALARHAPEAIARAASDALDAAASKVHKKFFTEPTARGIDLLRASLALYLSTVSPLPRTVTLEAGPLATGRLLDLTRRQGDYARTFRQQARAALAGAAPEERAMLVHQFPGTPAAQEALAGLFAEAAKATGLARRRMFWRLGETADLTAARVPDEHRAETHLAARPHAPKPLVTPMKDRAVDFADPAGGLRRVLPRQGDLETRPELVFVSGRAKKRLDNKFEVACVDARTGRKLWTSANIRLKGRGMEPGFTEAFVRGPLVVV